MQLLLEIAITGLILSLVIIQCRYFGILAKLKVTEYHTGIELAV